MRFSLGRQGAQRGHRLAGLDPRRHLCRGRTVFDTPADLSEAKEISGSGTRAVDRFGHLESHVTGTDLRPIWEHERTRV